MISFEVEGIPTPWAAHKGYGRKAYNPRYSEKQQAIRQIRRYHNQEAPITGPVRLYLEFHLPIPKGTSKDKKKQMLNNQIHPIKKPDVTNLQKFIEDCLKGLVIVDDSQVVEINARKMYSEKPKTIIQVGVL